MGSIIYLIIAIGLSIPFFVKIIKPGETALVMTLGRYSSTKGPGMEFLIPGIQSIIRVDMTEQILNIPEQKIITANSREFLVDGSMKCLVTDPYKSRFSVADIWGTMLEKANKGLLKIGIEIPAQEHPINAELLSTRLLLWIDDETKDYGVKVVSIQLNIRNSNGEISSNNARIDTSKPPVMLQNRTGHISDVSPQIDYEVLKPAKEEGGFGNFFKK